MLLVSTRDESVLRKGHPLQMSRNNFSNEGLRNLCAGVLFQKGIVPIRIFR
jgi:hypothetical protein